MWLDNIEDNAWFLQGSLKEHYNSLAIFYVECPQLQFAIPQVTVA